MAEDKLRYIMTLDTSGFTKKLDGVSSRLKRFGKNMSIFVTAPLVAAGKSMVDAASDSVEAWTKVDAVFKTLSGSVHEWSKTTASSIGTSQAAAEAFISTIGSMAQNNGIAEKTALDMAKGITVLAADLASFHNTSVDVAQEGLTAIFTGNAKALKKFGIVMTVANLEAYALSQGITKSYKDMTEAEKVTLRYNFVLSKSKDAQGDFARTSGNLANQSRILKASFSDLSSELGSILIPYVQKAVGYAQKLVEAFRELDPVTQKIVVAVAALVAVIGPLALVFSAISAIVGVLAPLFAALSLPVVAIAAAVAALGYLIYKEWDFIVFLTNKVKDAFVEWYDNTILIKPAVEAMVKIWKKAFDFIVKGINKIKELWDKLKNSIPGYAETVNAITPTGTTTSSGDSGPVDPLAGDIGEPTAYFKWLDSFEALKDKIGKSITELTQTFLSGGVTSAAEAFGQAIGNGGDAINAAGTALLQSLADFLKNLGTQAIKFAVAAIGIATLVEKIQKAMFANPVVAIVGGLALVALAGVLSSVTANAQGGLNSGGASASTPSSAPRQTVSPTKIQGFGKGGQLVATVRGQDLRFMLQGANDSYSARG